MIVTAYRAFKRLEGPITVTGAPVVTYPDGRPVRVTPAPRTVIGVLQNATPEDLKVLPEGNRNVTAIKIHSKERLADNEVVSYDGRDWLVHNDAYRQIGGYTKVLAIWGN